MGFFKRKSAKALSVNPTSRDSEANRKSNGTLSSLASTNGRSIAAKALQSPSLVGGKSNFRSPLTASFGNGIHMPKVDIPRAPDPAVDPAGYLRSIHAVRERCRIVMELAKANQLKHFDVDMTKMDQTVKWVVGIIRVSKAADRA
jgi:hypothetical protein